MSTIISQIIEVLKGREYSFSELLEIFREQNLTRKELKNIIKKIIKISKYKDWKLYYKPSVCQNCGYEIKNYLPISKCPKCKSEKLDEIKYFIR